MSVTYNGIELEAPGGPVVMSHSIYLDMIRGESGTRNMDWTQVLFEIPWGKVKEACPDVYENAGRISSLLNLDYQVCNGGIDQYFFNRYDEAGEPLHDNDVRQYDVEQQKQDFLALVAFGRALFPLRDIRNDSLERAANAFNNLIFERDAETSEFFECDEDEYILDEETGEMVENPDYFEPYEEFYEEDVIHNSEMFNDIFYDANDYMEELLEYAAQLQCRVLARDLDNLAKEHPDAARVLKESLPSKLFKKESLIDRIQNAQARADAGKQNDVGREQSPTL